MDWFQIGKGVQVCILSPCLFNFYAEYIIWNSGLNEEQAGININSIQYQYPFNIEFNSIQINIAGRNISNLRYADDITLMAERKEELKILFLNVKDESEKAGLKFNIQKTKIMASVPITSWQI